MLSAFGFHRCRYACGDIYGADAHCILLIKIRSRVRCVRVNVDDVNVHCYLSIWMRKRVIGTPSGLRDLRFSFCFLTLIIPCHFFAGTHIFHIWCKYQWRLISLLFAGLLVFVLGLLRVLMVQSLGWLFRLVVFRYRRAADCLVRSFHPDDFVDFGFKSIEIKSVHRIVNREAEAAFDLLRYTYQRQQHKYYMYMYIMYACVYECMWRCLLLDIFICKYAPFG